MNASAGVRPRDNDDDTEVRNTKRPKSLTRVSVTVPRKTDQSPPASKAANREPTSIVPVASVIRLPVSDAMRKSEEGKKKTLPDTLTVNRTEGRVFYDAQDPARVKRYVCLRNFMWEIRTVNGSGHIVYRSWEYDFDTHLEDWYSTVAVPVNNLSPESFVDETAGSETSSRFAVFRNPAHAEESNGFIGDETAMLRFVFDEISEKEVVVKRVLEVPPKAAFGEVVQTYDEHRTALLAKHLWLGGADVKGMDGAFLAHLVIQARLGDVKRAGSLQRRLRAAQEAAKRIEQSRSALSALYEEEAQAERKLQDETNKRRLAAKATNDALQAQLWKQAAEANAKQASEHARRQEEDMRRAAAAAATAAAQKAQTARKASAQKQKRSAATVPVSDDRVLDRLCKHADLKLVREWFNDPGMVVLINTRFLQDDRATARRAVVHEISEKHIREAMEIIKNAGRFSLPAFVFFMTGLHIDPAQPLPLSESNVKRLKTSILGLYHPEVNAGFYREVYREVMAALDAFIEAAYPTEPSQYTPEDEEWLRQQQQQPMGSLSRPVIRGGQGSRAKPMAGFAHRVLPRVPRVARMRALRR